MPGPRVLSIPARDPAYVRCGTLRHMRRRRFAAFLLFVVAAVLATSAFARQQRPAASDVSRGTPLGQAPLTLPAADAAGRIQLASQLPLDTFPPGSYTLELIAARGAEREVRTASFRLME
jgi:hypothetical protein